METFKIVHVDVSPGRSSLDALLFLKTVLSRCRGKPLVKVDHGPWYNWALDLLDCDYEKETFGERSLSDSVFSLFKYRILLFWKESPYRSSVNCLGVKSRGIRLVLCEFHTKLGRAYSSLHTRWSYLDTSSPATGTKSTKDVNRNPRNYRTEIASVLERVYCRSSRLIDSSKVEE